MTEIFTIICISVFFLVISLIGLGIRILVKDNGEFPGTCSSNNPLNEDGGCSICGATEKEKCQSNETDQGPNQNKNN